MNPPIHQLLETFAILTPELTVEPRDVSPDFYPSLNTDFDGFAGHVLISAHRFDSAWETWECHPNGDEIVILLSGSAIMQLAFSDDTSSVSLNQAGQYVVVPKGIWHTATEADDASMLFITSGEGTENRTEI